MKPARREFVLSLLVLSSSAVLLRQTSATSFAQDGTDVTPTEVNDRTYYKTGGGTVQPLRIAAAERDPFFSKQLTPSGDSFSGYLVDVVEEISRTVPFQVEWVVVDKDEADGRRKNGNSWAELTGKLFNGVANVSVLPIDSANLTQSRRFSYSHPFLKSTLSLLARAPEIPSDHRPWLLENLLNASDHSRLGFGVTSEGVAYQLKTSNSSLYKQIWNDRSPSEIVVPLEDGLRKVRQGDFLLIMESNEADYHASREPCNLLAHDQFTHETGYVFATRRNTSLVGLLNDALERLRQGDFFAGLYRKWWNTDDCTLRRGETERDDRDLDMERIFFTSPIKFFKSKDTLDSPRSGSFVTAQSTQPDVDPEDFDRGPDLFEEFRHGRLNTIAEQTTRLANVEWHQRSDRTTHPPPPLPSTSGVPSFEVRVQTDPEFNRKSRRRSRRPKQTPTTMSLRTQVPQSWTSPRRDFEAQSPIPRTERTRISPSHSRWSDGSFRDTIQSSDHYIASNNAATPVQSRTTKSSRDFAKDFEWVFVTEQPRSDEEFDYESDDYDDDVYHEQRITVRIIEAKQKDPIKVLNSKDTGKSSRKSSEKSSSSKIEFSSVLTVAVVSVFLLITRRFSL